MSLMREGLRTIIRTFAPMVVIGYIIIKFYAKIKDAPLIVSTVNTYKTLFKKLMEKGKTDDDGCIDQ